MTGIIEKGMMSDEKKIHPVKKRTYPSFSPDCNGIAMSEANCNKVESGRNSGKMHALEAPVNP